MISELLRRDNTDEKQQNDNAINLAMKLTMSVIGCYIYLIKMLLLIHSWLV